jgi:hypothetical protein
MMLVAVCCAFGVLESAYCAVEEWWEGGIACIAEFAGLCCMRMIFATTAFNSMREK